MKKLDINYIKTEFPNMDWICDKQINNGCSKRRPDILLDLRFKILIIEIDENQHNNYDCSCENDKDIPDSFTRRN